MSARGQCDKLLVMVLALKLNFGGVLIFGKVFTKIV